MKSSLVFVLLLAACHSKAPNYSKKNNSSNSTVQPGTTPGVDNMEGVTEPLGGMTPTPSPGSQTPEGAKLTAPGSAMSFIDANGLNVVYSRIFSKGPQGYVHCSQKKPLDLADCESVFNSQERATLGTFALYGAAMNRGENNVGRVNGVSLNYLRSLRAGLSRECEKLVRTEIANLRMNNVASNILVKAEAPTETHIETFYRKILDIENQAALIIDLPTAGYAADFTKTMALMPDQSKAQQNAFLNLCIAVAMDPTVILY